MPEAFKTLEALGLTLPGPAYLIGALVFSIIGYIGYRHGKKAGQPIAKWLGIVLMLYSYVVANTWLMYAAGAGLCAALAWFWKHRSPKDEAIPR